MMEWILAQPFWVAAGFLTCVCAFRSQLTYWLGRGIHAGVIRTKWAQKLANDKAQRAVDALERWGWPIIPISFLTLGFQTAVQFTAGLLGWRWLPYTLAAMWGWMLWGCAYAAGGLAAFVALFALASKAWWLAVIAVVLVVAIVAGVIIWRRRRAVAAQ